MARLCVMCGCQLHPSEPSYVRYCKPCYRRMKQAEQDELVNELEALRSEVVRLRTQARSTPGPIDAQMLRVLLQLCHPDKHGGSSLSNKATAWLLQQKGNK